MFVCVYIYIWMHEICAWMIAGMYVSGNMYWRSTKTWPDYILCKCLIFSFFFFLWELKMEKNTTMIVRPHCIKLNCILMQLFITEFYCVHLSDYLWHWMIIWFPESTWQWDQDSLHRHSWHWSLQCGGETEGRHIHSYKGRTFLSFTLCSENSTQYLLIV